MYTSALVMFIGRDDVCVSLNGFAQNEMVFYHLQDKHFSWLAKLLFKFHGTMDGTWLLYGGSVESDCLGNL